MNEPKLRFKADDGNQFPSWDEKKLGDICTPLTYGMNVAAIKYDGLNKYIRITDIDDESHLYKSDEYVSPNGVLDDRYLVGENDILFARTGASVGKSYIYNKKDGKLYYAGFLIKAHVKSENSNFVFYQTLTERYAKWVQLTSMRSGQPGINANEYSEFGIQIPCLQEQQKIASLFTELDDLIQSAEKELDGYRELKQGMLQKMFPKNGEATPEIRFPEFTGDWEPHKLGEVATFINGRAYSQDELLHNGKYKVLRVGNFYTNNSWYYSDMELDEKYYATDGDLLYTWSATFGPHIWHGGKVIYHYHIWKVELSDMLEKRFAVQLLEQDKTKILSDKNGSTMVHITKSGMEQKEVLLPSSVAEQTRIGAYFESLDNLIALQQKELDGYKELKKGLLQQMFC